MEHLTRIQRYEISSKLEAGFSKVQIAKGLCMDRSTIYRELRRNSNQKTGVYDPELADKKYRRRMSEKPKRKTFTEEMRSLAAELLTKQLSPEQIKGRCDLLGVPMVSHERLYQFVWEDKKKGARCTNISAGMDANTAGEGRPKTALYGLFGAFVFLGKLAVCLLALQVLRKNYGWNSPYSS
ncbi:MAG: IS30 family transposase [Bacteroidales bacterium]|nr:IS30 family transposase [Bacteroidales bacterium]